MYAKLMLSAMALLMACKMFAVQLTPQQALARMNSTKLQSKGIAANNSSLQLTYTSTFNGNNTYYVFNKGNEEGFLILSADDCMPAVLGVVEGSHFDYDKLPPSMKWWLSQYDASISSYSALGKKYAASTTTRKDIAPLLGDIKFGQRHPYNLLCPFIGYRQAPSGCVATAMAQVMCMYQWPKNGYGKNEYDLNIEIGVDENNIPQLEKIHITGDFTKSIYKWDKMVHKYYGDETEEQNLAVAQLMYDCGVAVSMGYNKEESGAYMHDAFSALIKNFSYDKNARWEYQSLYDIAEWENMVYDNINKGMPIILSGCNRGQRYHAYVCDGYQSDGNLFHFNWGWGGDCDGYFLLTSIETEHSDNDGLYNLDQVGIFNLKPSATPYVEGAEDEFPLVVTRPYCIMKYDPNTEVYVKTDRVSRNDECQFGDDSFYLQYQGFVPHEYAIGVKFKNETEEYIFTSIQYSMPAFDLFRHYLPIEFEGIPKNGRYTVSFVYKDITAGNTEWKDAQYLPGISKPEVEVVGTEHFCKIPEAAELIYNGKRVTDGIIVKVPNVDDITVKLKVMALKPLKYDRLEMNVYNMDYDNFHSDYRPLDISNAEANTVQTVTTNYYIGHILPSVRYGIRFVQKISGKIIPAYYPGSLEFTILEAPTGIETIPQAEEKAATETIYDIYGRKVNTMNRGGLYIKNGKKYLVK